MSQGPNSLINVAYNITQIERVVDWSTHRNLWRLGPVLVKGISVWRTKGGSRRVYFPRYKAYGGSEGYFDAIELAPGLREEIETEVISAVRQAQKKRDAEEKALGTRKATDASDRRYSE
jgi:hypothetical protein